MVYTDASPCPDPSQESNGAGQHQEVDGLMTSRVISPSVSCVGQRAARVHLVRPRQGAGAAGLTRPSPVHARRVRTGPHALLRARPPGARDSLNRCQAGGGVGMSWAGMERRSPWPQRSTGRGGLCHSGRCHGVKGSDQKAPGGAGTRGRGCRSRWAGWPYRPAGGGEAKRAPRPSPPPPRPRGPWPRSAGTARRLGDAAAGRSRGPPAPGPRAANDQRALAQSHQRARRPGGDGRGAQGDASVNRGRCADVWQPWPWRVRAR